MFEDGESAVRAFQADGNLRACTWRGGSMECFLNVSLVASIFNNF